MDNKELIKYMNYSDYKEDIEIDLLDLIYHVFCKWRVMIIWMLLGAVVAGAFSYIKSSKASVVEPASKESELENLRASLSEGNAVVVEQTADQYIVYFNKYMKLKEYAENSVFMKLDPTSIPTITSYYVIEDHSEKHVISFDEADNENGSVTKNGEVETSLSKPISLRALYRAEILSDPIINEIHEAMGDRVEEIDVPDLVYVDVEGEKALTVSVYGTDYEMCRAITDIIMNHMDDITEKIKEGYDHDIYFLESSAYTQRSDNILSYQRSINNDMYSLKYDMDYIGSKFTDDSKKYYEALIASKIEELLDEEGNVTSDDLSESDEKGTVGDSTDSNQAIMTVTKGHVSKKYMALGLIVGIFLVACWYAIKYIISSKLHTADDIRDALHLMVIGEINVSSDERTNPIDKLLDWIFGKGADDVDNKLEVIGSNIGISAKKADAKNILLIGASSDEVSVDFRNRIKEKAESDSKEIKVDVAESVISNAHSMQKLSEADMVVFVEKKDKSKFAHIMREVELCNEFGTEVIGAVVIS